VTDDGQRARPLSEDRLRFTAGYRKIAKFSIEMNGHLPEHAFSETSGSEPAAAPRFQREEVNRRLLTLFLLAPDAVDTATEA
jgi:hypothetical protein